jgi:tetratricopeptide (TPR) repeat protein
MKPFTSSCFAIILVLSLSFFSNVSVVARNVENNANYLLHWEHLDDPRYGKDSSECVRNWSVYDEFVKHGALDLAYKPWKYVFENCPLITQNIYVHGVNIVKYQYDNETDPEKKAQWVDLLLRVFDQRIQYFGNEGFVLGRKASMLYQVQPDNTQELFELTQRSIELTGMNVESPVLSINFLVAVLLEKAGKIDQTDIIDLYLRALDIIDYNLERDPSDKQFFQHAKTSVQALYEPYGTCENLVRVFSPGFDGSSQDPALLKRIANLLDNAGCTDTELFFLATKKLHQIAPDAASAFLLGRLENTRQNFDVAIRYFQEAADRYAAEDRANSRDDIFRAYWLMAEISYRQLKQIPQARTHARKAMEAKPNDGRPLLLIGEMYAASARECGHDEFSRKSAYWAAVDKFIQAAAAAEEATIKERAQLLAETYRQYFPNSEEIFFNGFSLGDSYRVECWINETTTIRAR